MALVRFGCLAWNPRRSPRYWNPQCLRWMGIFVAGWSLSYGKWSVDWCDDCYLYKSIIVVSKYYGGFEDPKALSYSKLESGPNLEECRYYMYVCGIFMDPKKWIPVWDRKITDHVWSSSPGIQSSLWILTFHLKNFLQLQTALLVQQWNQRYHNTNYLLIIYKLPMFFSTRSYHIVIHPFFPATWPGNIAPKRFFGSCLSAWSAHTQICKLQGVHWRMPRLLVVSFQVSDASSQELADAKFVRNEVSWKITVSQKSWNCKTAKPFQ